MNEAKDDFSRYFPPNYTGSFPWGHFLLSSAKLQIYVSFMKMKGSIGGENWGEIRAGIKSNTMCNIKTQKCTLLVSVLAGPHFGLQFPNRQCREGHGS